MSESTIDQLSQQWIRCWESAPELRRRYGVFYTPRPLAALLTELALDRLGREPHRVLEPSCGSGSFLAAFGEASRRRWGWTAEQHGRRVTAVERDPVAADLARRRGLGEVVVADFLERWDGAKPAAFDLILGNPPFGGAIRGDTGRSPEEKRRFKQRFPLAARGAYDRSALFVERSLELLHPDGVLAFVLPRQLLGAPAARALRRRLATMGPPELVEIESSQLFGSADVHVFGLLVGATSAGSTRAAVHALRDASETGQSEGSPLAVRTRQATFLPDFDSWSPLMEGTASIVAAARAFPTLSEFLDISASATTAEAYDWKSGVDDASSARPTSDPASGLAKAVADCDAASFPLVVSGSIDPFFLRWGERRTRYLGEDFLRPVVSASVMSARRQRQAAQPKVLMPGLSRSLEAMVDERGELAGAVATLSVLAKPASSMRDGHEVRQLRRIAAMLNSAWCRLQYRSLFAATAMAGGNVAVSKSKLAGLRVPPEWRRWVTDSVAAPPWTPEALEKQVPREFSRIAQDILSAWPVGEAARGASGAGDAPASDVAATADSAASDTSVFAVDSASPEKAGTASANPGSRRAGPALYKRVAEPSELALFAALGRVYAQRHPRAVREAVLDELLRTSPRNAIDTGVLDVLLWSLAEDSGETVAMAVPSGR